MYKLRHGLNSVVRVSDGAYIPFSNGNVDYEDYKRWLAAGNTSLPDSEWESANSLPILREARINKLWTALYAYAEFRFDSNSRTAVNTYITLNLSSSNPTVQAKVAKAIEIFNWSLTVWGYYATIKGQILVSATPETVTWDTTQFDITWPKMPVTNVDVTIWDIFG